jgi:hypothetical protein
MPSPLAGFDGAHLGLLWRSIVIETEEIVHRTSFPQNSKAENFEEPLAFRRIIAQLSLAFAVPGAQ